MTDCIDSTRISQLANPRIPERVGRYDDRVHRTRHNCFLGLFQFSSVLSSSYFETQRIYLSHSGQASRWSGISCQARILIRPTKCSHSHAFPSMRGRMTCYYCALPIISDNCRDYLLLLWVPICQYQERWGPTAPRSQKPIIDRISHPPGYQWELDTALQDSN